MNKTLRTLLALTLALGLVLGMAIVADAKNATRLTVNPRSVTMDWGSSTTLTVITTPTNASDRYQIQWAEGDDPNDLIAITHTADPRKVTVTVAALGVSYPDRQEQHLQDLHQAGQR